MYASRRFRQVVVVVGFFFSSILAFAQPKFPENPNPSLTPGKLCEHADEFRYPERIPYCRRNVTPQTKDKTIVTYDSKLGFEIKKMDRREFKIDHLVPLCAGGSNDESNLWPQHETVYAVTDPLEPAICEKMAEGKLKQAEAMRLVLKAKQDLSQVEGVLNYIQSL